MRVRVQLASSLHPIVGSGAAFIIIIPPFIVHNWQFFHISF